MGKPTVSPALTTALRRSCSALDLGPGSSVTTFRSVPTDDSTDETMMFSCGNLSDPSRVLAVSSTHLRAMKRVTEVTRFAPAEEVGFEPTVPVDTAVFETARFGRSRTPPITSLQLDLFGTFGHALLFFVMESDDERFMTAALEEARRSSAHNDVPVGCVLVANGEILSVGENRREADADPTAHAEIVALREAAKKRGRWR